MRIIKYCVVFFVLITLACKKEEITVAKHNGTTITDSLAFDVSEGQTNWTKIPYDTIYYYGVDNSDSLKESSITSISFSNNQVGFIAGYDCYHEPDYILKKTINGGQSWSSVPFSGVFCTSRYIDNILILSPTHLIVAYASGGPCLFTEKYSETIDGGNTWFNSTIFNSCNCTVLDSLHLICDRAKTIDGGINWTPVTYPYNTTKFIFNDINSGYCVTNDGLVAQTTDGCTTWDTLLYNSDEKFKTINVNGTTIIVSGNHIYRSVDAGTSWTDVSDKCVNDIKFVNSQIGFAAVKTWDGKGEILKTIDGGNTWTINYTSSFIGFTKLFVLNQMTIIAVGTQSKGLPDLKNVYIVKTTTQGE